MRVYSERIGRRRLARAAGHEVASFDPFAHLLDLGAEHRLRPARHLEAVVLGRIVAAGHHQAGIGSRLRDRVIEGGRRHDTDSPHLEPAENQALLDSSRKPVAAGPDVTAQGDDRAILGHQVLNARPTASATSSVSSVSEAADVVPRKIWAGATGLLELEIASMNARGRRRARDGRPGS
jgi:hypothetical protein